MRKLDLWKQRKKDLKLTYEDIAEKTGIAISTIKAIFGGATYAPRIDTVQAIEKVLKLDEDWESGSLTHQEMQAVNMIRNVKEHCGEEAQNIFINTILGMGELMLKNEK